MVQHCTVTARERVSSVDGAGFIKNLREKIRLENPTESIQNIRENVIKFKVIQQYYYKIIFKQIEV